MNFEKNNSPVGGDKADGEKVPKDPIAAIREELANDYKNFKDPDFYFPGGKPELEKAILEKEDSLRIMEAEKPINDLRSQLIDDYKNFKDPNFYFPGGKSELEKVMIEKENEIRFLEGNLDNDKEKKPDDLDIQVDNNQELVTEGTEEIVQEDTQESIQEDVQESDQENIQENTQEDFQEDLQEDTQEGIQEVVQEVVYEDDQEDSQEEENRERRGRTFEFIRKHPKLKWTIAATMITAIGLGIFKAVEASQDNERKVDNKELVVDPSIELKSQLERSGADISKINNDVLDTILEEVGDIARIEVFDPGDGIGVITKTVENNMTNVMSGDTPVNFIDAETGAIYKDQAASSVLVHPGDLVLENSAGEYFVIADKAGLNYEKPVSQPVELGDTSDEIKETKNADNQEETAVVSPDSIAKEDIKGVSGISENNPNTDVKNERAEAEKSDIDNPEPWVAKKGVPNLADLEKEAIDLSEQARKDKVDQKIPDQEVVDTPGDDDVSRKDSKIKKGFWKKIFGGDKKK